MHEPAPKVPGHPPRMVDVARHAGVSRALVSIVLNGKPGASPATRERVLEATAQLGYTPDLNARRLRAGTNALIGVIFEGHDPFTACVLDTIHQATARRGLDLVLTMMSHATPLSHALRTLADQRVRGTLLVSSAAPDDDAAALLAQAPCAVVGAYAPEALDGAISSVHTDDAAAMHQVIDHLATRGCQRLIVVGVAGRRSGSVRAEAAASRAQQLGLETVTVTAAGYSESDGVQVSASVLPLVEAGEAQRPRTAVVAANDALALGILHALRAAGLRVPQDVSLTGFDDAPGAYSCARALGLTTVRQDVDGIVEAALSLLEALPQAGTSEQVLPGTLVVRPSSLPQGAPVGVPTRRENPTAGTLVAPGR